MGPTTDSRQVDPQFTARKDHLRSLCELGWQNHPDTVAVHGTSVEALDLIAKRGDLPGSPFVGVYPELGRLYFFMVKADDIQAVVNANPTLYKPSGTPILPPDLHTYDSRQKEIVEGTQGYAVELARDVKILDALGLPMNGATAHFCKTLTSVVRRPDARVEREEIVESFLNLSFYKDDADALEVARSLRESPEEVYELVASTASRGGVILGFHRDIISKYRIHPGDENIARSGITAGESRSVAFINPITGEPVAFDVSSKDESLLANRTVLPDFMIPLGDKGLPMDLITEAAPNGPEVAEYFTS